jgi:hypothetical protein
MNHYALISKPTGTRTRCGETVLRCDANPSQPVTCTKCRALLADKVQHEAAQADITPAGQIQRMHAATAKHFASVLAA